MAKRASRKHQWLIAVSVTFAVILCAAAFSYFLLAKGVIVPYEKNGLDKVSITCDGSTNFISTQRYIGFSDYAINEFHSFADLPITSRLSCDSFTVEFQRKASLLDRFGSDVFCDNTLLYSLSSGSEGSGSCPGELRIEVYRR